MLGNGIKYDNNHMNAEIIEYKNTTPKTLNLVVLGLDEEETRSDVIALLNYNLENGDLNILSIPRDTRVLVNGEYTKVNALVGMGGERLLIDKLEELTDLPIDFYFTINFKGFRQIIDELGGVELTIKTNMDYDDPEQNLHIHLKKGKRLLDGEKAEEFVRYRKGNRAGTGYTFGDLDRVKAQQEFIKAFIDQKAKLKYISKANEVFLILKKYMRTNVEIGDLSLFVEGLAKLKPNEIKTYTLPGDSKVLHDVWYFIYNRESTIELVKSSFSK